MARTRALVAWSSGKDSAWALHTLRTSTDVEVLGLLTTLNATHERVSMHAVRRTLLEQQAAAVGLPVTIVPIPSPCSNEAYAQAMARALGQARADGVNAVAFGDLFLADVRRYREQQMAGTGVTPLFPLWGQPTALLARQMIAAGLRATLTCVDPRTLPAELAGHAFDQALLDELPPQADPCGENGEFHTFVWDGPMFDHGIALRAGRTLTREGFVFADLLPEEVA